MFLFYFYNIKRYKFLEVLIVGRTGKNQEELKKTDIWFSAVKKLLILSSRIEGHDCFILS
jgi:hypothetical protein